MTTEGSLGKYIFQRADVTSTTSCTRWWHIVACKTHICTSDLCFEFTVSYVGELRVGKAKIANTGSSIKQFILHGLCMHTSSLLCFFFTASPVRPLVMASAPSFEHPFQLCRTADLHWQAALTQNCAPGRNHLTAWNATTTLPYQAVAQLKACLSVLRHASHNNSMHRSTAPTRAPMDITAVEVAPLAPIFARGSAYVPFVLLLLLLLLRQVSVAPLVAVTVVVTLLMWLMNCGSVFQYLQHNKKYLA